MFMDYIEDYLNWVKVKGLVTSTIKTKRQTMKKFKIWLTNHNYMNIMSVGRKEIDSYISETFKNLTCIYKNDRIRQFIGGVKEYFKFLFMNGHILYNPAEEIDLPSRDSYLPRGVLNESEIKILLNLPDKNTYSGFLHSLIMEILYSTGLRNNELVSLKIFDINFEEGTLFVRQGKGMKDRIVPIGDIALNQVRQYINNERLKVSKNSQETTLLLNELGNPVRKNVICRMIKQYITKAGINKKISVHSFRHTFAVHLLKGGADIFSIKEMLGHTSLGTTQIYLKLQNQDLKDTHERCHPREKMIIKDGGKNHENKQN